MKSRKAVIVIDLVAESAEATKKEIEKDILEELSKPYPIIPWLKNVEKITVMEN